MSVVFGVRYHAHFMKIGCSPIETARFLLDVKSRFLKLLCGSIERFFSS